MHNGHLSIEEVEQLNQQKGPAENQSHLENCRQCSALLEKYRSVSAKLDKLASVRLGARNGMNCPDENVWFDVAAGTISSDDSLGYVRHAAECESCGQKLRTATRMFQEELTEEEEEKLRALPSAGVKRQRKLAEQMAQATSGSRSPARENAKQHRGVFWRPLMWAASAACLVAVAFALRGLYLQRELVGVQRLVAAEYQKGRPMPYRVAGVPYGPFREERGDRSILPSVEVPTKLKDPVLAAQAALLELDSANAITLLNTARASGNDSPLVLDNLLVAYAVRAEQTGSRADYEEALRLSDEIVRSNPSDPTMYFNRALVLEKLGRTAEARGAVQQCLNLENDPNWRAEAARVAR